MRLGIFGGTFNPIHLGHLLLAETARETLRLDRVVFVPTRQPPHKRAKDLLPGDARMKLIALAIKDHPAFVASDIELQRPGPSYSIETVKILKGQLPQAKLFLIVGEDMLAVRWVAWEELKRLCTIVVARRPAPPPVYSPKANQRGVEGHRPFGPKTGGGVKRLPMPLVEISSSDVRARLLAGRSIRYLVPTAVERYIQQHQLYPVVRPSVDTARGT
ncbi:MAG: nicotinate (nicotinamide) nucleotide adenylyltransferase [Candidatus Omnitrophica bacterium]|nr:nicotinate (nicotinamide) nucleotide adenylyltransferase [Candidatus Omnitrophota bacterium]